MSLILFLTLKSLSPMYAAFILYGLTTTTCNCSIIREYDVPENLADDICNEISDESQQMIPFECKVLSTDEIAVLPNGTLYIDRLDLLLNSTVYTVVGNTITVCAPKRTRGVNNEQLNREGEEKVFRKPIYFSLLALMFQLQVPVVACMNRGFRGIAAPLFASFFACFLGAYYIVPVDLWLGDPSSFFAPWFSGPSILCFLSLTSVAWLSLLTSDPVLGYLKSIDHVAVDNNNIVIRGYSAIIQLTLLLGSGIAVFTYAVVHSGLIERHVGLPTSFRDLEKMLPFFFPPVFVLTTINVFLKIVGKVLAAKCVARGSASWRISMRDRNWVFFNLHMFVVAYWIFGCIVVVREVMWVWNIFASLSVMMPAFIITAACLPGATKRTSNRFIINKSADGGKLALLTIKVDSPVKEVP